MHAVRIDFVLPSTKVVPHDVTSPTGEHCTTVREPGLGTGLKLKMAKGAEGGHEVEPDSRHPRRPVMLENTGVA
jgi:hypothetical protein